MTLHRRLAWGYGAIAMVCLALLGILAHHQHWTESELHRRVGQLPDDTWSGLIAGSVYVLVPVVLLAGWWLMRRTLAPIHRLTEALKRIHAHNLREVVLGAGDQDEAGQLTEAFNAMTARLDAAFRQVHEFTLNASHELKTPLTVMRAELETAMREAEALPSASREWMRDQLDEIERLTKIVDGLTLLTKADAGQLAVVWDPVWLAELMRESFEDAQILAEPHGVSVTLGQCADLVTAGDRHRFRQVLLNLVDNAIKYNRPQGTVTMALRPAGNDAEIEIVNTGAGIPPGLQTRIFERFVRGDEARRRAIEGCGLGLATVRCIVEAYCGTIRISSLPGQTTTVIVRLPQLDPRRPSTPRAAANPTLPSAGG